MHTTSRFYTNNNNISGNGIFQYEKAHQLLMFFEPVIKKILQNTKKTAEDCSSTNADFESNFLIGISTISKWNGDILDIGVKELKQLSKAPYIEDTYRDVLLLYIKETFSQPKNETQLIIKIPPFRDFYHSVFKHVIKIGAIDEYTYNPDIISLAYFKEANANLRRKIHKDAIRWALLDCSKKSSFQHKTLDNKKENYIVSSLSSLPIYSGSQKMDQEKKIENIYNYPQTPNVPHSGRYGSWFVSSTASQNQNQDQAAIPNPNGSFHVEKPSQNFSQSFFHTSNPLKNVNTWLDKEIKNHDHNNKFEFHPSSPILDGTVARPASFIDFYQNIPDNHDDQKCNDIVQNNTNTTLQTSLKNNDNIANVQTENLTKSIPSTNNNESNHSSSCSTLNRDLLTTNFLSNTPQKSNMSCDNSNNITDIDNPKSQTILPITKLEDSNTSVINNQQNVNNEQQQNYELSTQNNTINNNDKNNTSTTIIEQPQSQIFPKSSTKYITINSSLTKEHQPSYEQNQQQQQQQQQQDIDIRSIPANNNIDHYYQQPYNIARHQTQYPDQHHQKQLLYNMPYTDNRSSYHEQIPFISPIASSTSSFSYDDLDADYETYHQ